MKRKCPNNNCSNFNNSTTIVRDGYYQRKDDSKKIARFKCTHCGKRFSAATNSLYFGQKKRRINALVRKLLSSGVSMRRIAKIVKVHQITVARKVIFLAQLARMSQDELLNYLRKNKSMHIQFDDLITKENTKLKPLTVPLAVDVKTRIILSAEVAQIPAFGHLAEKARLKYGIRKSLHKDAMTKMFLNIKDCINKTALFESDEHKLYPEIVRKFFPDATHIQHKGSRGAIVGQGELKKINYDPLFSINHSCAMLRANINRLIRKTWCTTKKIHMLKAHLDIFIDYHNRELLKI